MRAGRGLMTCGLGAGMATLVCTLALSAPAGAVVTRQAGRFVSVAPMAGSPLAARLRRSAASPATAASRNLNYHGGPVMQKNKTYALYWDPAGTFTAANKALYTRYFTDVAADTGKSTNVFATTGQYTDATGRAAYSASFGGAFTDTQPYPAMGTCTDASADGGAPAPCLTDAQLQNEINRFRAANGLPKGLGTLYFVFTPAGVPVCFDKTGGDCSTSTFCAYHSSFGAAKNPTLYATIPDEQAFGKACQYDGNAKVQLPNGDPADLMLKAVSHEHAEAITDPLGNAWYTTKDGMENGDRCNSLSDDPNSFLPILGGAKNLGTLFNQRINANAYYLQSEWSNHSSSCDMQEPLTVSFTATPTTVAPGAPVALNASASTASLGIVSASWTFGDGSTGTGLTTNHAYAAVGNYKVKLTVTDGGGQTQSMGAVVRVRATP